MLDLKPQRYLLLFVLILFAVSQLHAQNLGSVMSAQQQADSAARQSQERVDDIVEQTRKVANDYSVVVKEIDGLKVYNALLQKQVDAQNREIAQLDDSMTQVTVIERQVIPLMVRMIDALEQFVSLDTPFLQEERTDRIASLRGMMERSDVTAAEKFRRVMESYQIENDYGRTIEAYQGSQNVAGANREVDYLRIGRVGLYYQTLDTQYSGAWDKGAGQWAELGNESRGQIRDGLRIARKQTAPDLLMLPVRAPEAAQ